MKNRQDGAFMFPVLHQCFSHCSFPIRNMHKSVGRNALAARPSCKYARILVVCILQVCLVMKEKSMSLLNKNILISGASIAGPSLAYWLKRYGFQPTIVERAPALREGGFPIDVRGAAADVAKRMGIWPQLGRRRAYTRELRLVDGSNRSRGTFNALTLNSALDFEDYWIELPRGDLAQVLYQATKDDVEYCFGDALEAIREDNEGVEVVFESGNTRRFDLVVGADGLHSKVRGLTFGAEARYERYGGYCVVVATIDNYMGLRDEARMYNIPGRAVAVRNSRSEQKAMAWFIFKQPEKPDIDYRNVEQQKQLVADLLAEVGWEGPVLAEKIRNAPDFFFDVVSQIHMERWSQGRVVLLGDAGYSPSLLTGRGTMLAMTGAYILAGELYAAGGNYQPAFHAYEHLFRPHVQQSQQGIDRGAAALVPSTWFAIWVREQVVRLLPLLMRTGGLWRKALSKPSPLIKEYEDEIVVH